MNAQGKPTVKPVGLRPFPYDPFPLRELVVPL